MLRFHNTLGVIFCGDDVTQASLPVASSRHLCLPSQIAQAGKPARLVRLEARVTPAYDAGAVSLFYRVAGGFAVLPAAALAKAGLFLPVVQIFRNFALRLP